MKLYNVQFDGVPYWVEATSFADAVTRWRNHVSVASGIEYSVVHEPDSVAVIHNGLIIR